MQAGQTARRPAAHPTPNEATVVVVGAGFGGLEVARRLGRAGIDTIVIDRNNHHLFQPLLYQVATAALSATDIAEPIRKILRRHSSVKVLFGDVSRVDTARRQVFIRNGPALGYKFLVVATGANHSYFGNSQWEQFAPGLKTIEDARAIRSRLLLTYELAERTDDPEERKRLLTVAVVGGGPTGVELAGAIAELSRYTLARDFRRISSRSTRILLLEAGPRLLPAFAPDLSKYAHARLEKLGVEVRLGQKVEEIGPTAVRIAGRQEPVGLVIWAAGVSASPLARQLGPTDKAGRVCVDASLAVRGAAGVFALGDAAAFTGEDGRPLPGLAQVAKQQGIHLGRNLASHIARGTGLEPFRYESRGNTAIVGRHAAVFEQGGFKITGWLAWIAWAIIHVYLLVGFEHRFLVSLQWLWRYVTFERGARLIAGQGREGKKTPAAMDGTAREQ